MKLAYAQGNVLASEGVQTTSAFGIARTPHMFNILSSGLYSDKIAAVIREISCNAMDAHVAGGCADKPFQVKLPGPLDRSFYVKDWGPGLDDQEVRELYTTYGWSSKQASDEMTGAFGLGSKSPFAYTMQNTEDSDGFTVVAVKGGVKRVYTCYIGSDGGPAISRLYEGPADEDWPHGVMVTFPVQRQDIAKFKLDAGRVLRWFKVKPEVLGLESPLVEQEYAFRGSFFGLRPQGADAWTSASVVTGNVCYPLRAKHLEPLSAVERALLEGHIVLQMPLGTVMMTPSREELQYSEATKAVLRDALAKAALELASYICDVARAPVQGLWLRHRHIHEKLRVLGPIVGAIPEFLDFAGVFDAEAKAIANVARISALEMPSWVGDGPEDSQMESPSEVGVSEPATASAGMPRKTQNCRVWRLEYNKAKEKMSCREVVRGVVHAGANAHKVFLSVSRETAVVYADAPAAEARVRALTRESDRLVFLVAPRRGTPASYAKEYAQRMCGKEGLEGLPLIAASALDRPERPAVARKQSKSTTGLAAKQKYANELVRFVGRNGKLKEATLGELDNGADAFYLVHPQQRRYRTECHNLLDDGSKVYFESRYADKVLSAIATVMDHWGLPFSGAIEVNNDGTARRLRFAEQGIRPLLPWFFDNLKNDKAFDAALKTGERPLAPLPLQDPWVAATYGFLGMLGHHAMKKTPFWEALVARVPESPLIPTVLSFVAAAVPGVQSNPLSAVVGAVGALARTVRGVAKNEETKVTCLTCWQVCDNMLRLAPSLQGLGLKNCSEMALSTEPVLRTRLLALLEFVLEQDNLRGQKGVTPRALNWAAG